VGVAPATIGYLISLMFGAATLALPFTSFAIPRWGACRATQVGLAVCALALVFALSASVAGLAACAILTGIGMTVMTPASGHLLFRFSPPQNRNFIFSVKQTGVPLGWMIMALVAPSITLAWGWRWALALVIFICVGTAAAMQRVRAHWDDDRRPAAARAASPFAGLKLLWGYPVLRWLAMAAMCLTFVQLCVATFLVTMLVEDGGYSLVAAGVLLSLAQAAGVAGRVLWGWIADRTRDALGLLQKIAITTTVCCVVSAFIGPGWPMPLLAAFLILFGLASIGWNGLFLAETAHASPRGMVSTVTSAAMVWNFSGVLIGPALFAATYNLTQSYAHTYGAMSIIALLGAVFLTLSLAAAQRTRA
jgi:MFS family permease